VSDLFSDAVFREAVADIESFGVRVLSAPQAGTTEYGIVGARSNTRWWLIPLESGRLAASGLALFQPLLANARRMKAAATFLSGIGLQRTWARQRVYVAGRPALGRFFDQGPDRFAYFTGTHSPDRKVAVQIMDELGELKGFAKLTRNPRVSALMRHEAVMLRHAAGLKLEHAHVPKVLFTGEINDASVLVTDTLKQRKTRSSPHLTDAHRRFLREIASRSACAVPAAEVARDFRQRVHGVEGKLDAKWRQRVRRALDVLDARGSRPVVLSFSQGDFTPWNTFLVEGKLYVFDWEYARDAQVAGVDLVHFVLNQPKFRSRPVADGIQAAMQALASESVADPASAPVVLVAYGLTQLLLQLERLPAPSVSWDNADQQAALLDQTLQHCETGDAELR
jgi:hypothetical protein